MFRTVPLPIIRSFSLYPQQCYMLYSFADSLRAGSGWNWFRPDPDGTDFVLILLASGSVLILFASGSVLILLASCQQTCMTYTIAVLTVKNS